MDKDHTHKHSKVVLKPINRITNKRYSGNIGDKTLVFRTCDCGNRIAIDYGSSDKIKDKYNGVIE